MQTVRDYVDSYFDKHGSTLEQTYPGLNSRNLLKEFKEFSLKNDNDIVVAKDLLFFDALAEKTPLAYIKSETFFYRSLFYINEDVLIPRVETEILVEDSVNFLRKLNISEVAIAEVGVGSFVIGLSLLADLKNPVSFWAGDISKQALSVAKTNYFRLKHKIHPKTNIQFAQADRLLTTQKKFHLIVSNPPYIRQADKETVHPTVLASEPHIALFLADAEYNQWFEDFFKDTSKKLQRGGAFFMEGHEDTLSELANMAQTYFTNVSIKKDYTGRDRFLHCFL